MLTFILVASAGCVQPWTEDRQDPGSVALPTLADFEGCDQVYPDGTPAPCEPLGQGLPVEAAPPDRATCTFDGRGVQVYHDEATGRHWLRYMVDELTYGGKLAGLLTVTIDGETTHYTHGGSYVSGAVALPSTFGPDDPATSLRVRWTIWDLDVNTTGALARMEHTPVLSYYGDDDWIVHRFDAADEDAFYTFVGQKVANRTSSDGEEWTLWFPSGMNLHGDGFTLLVVHDRVLDRSVHVDLRGLFVPDDCTRP